MSIPALEDLSLISLADSINSDVKVIIDMLTEQKLPQPTLSPGGSMTYPGGPENVRLQEARMNLLTSAWALEQLAAGPQDYIYWQGYTAKHDLTVLSTFARFGVFEAVPATGDISYSDLAAKLPLTERQVRRLLRHAMTKNIFYEPHPDHVAHTSLSIAPVKNSSLVPWLNHNLGEILPASSRLPDAVERYGESQDPTETPLSIAWNLEKGKGLFDWFKEDGEGDKKGWRARQFADSMAAMDGGGHDLKFTLEGFDWASLGKATVVDLGGSSGHISITIARAHPTLNLIVQDLPEVEPAFHALVPSDLKSRVSFHPHNFMLPQPLNTPSVYLLRHVLHDWSDGLAVKILRNLIDSEKGLMENGTRIIIQDNIMPERGVRPPPLERLITTADLQMWTAVNALERRKEDWIELFSMVDERLEVVAFVQPEGCSDTIIEVIFRHK